MNLKTLIFSVINAFAVLGVSAQQQTAVDFTVANYQITINPLTKEVSGSGELIFDVLKPVDSIFIDAHYMEFESLELNSSEVKYNVHTNKLLIHHDFEPSNKNSLSFNFKAYPKQTIYFVGWDSDAPNQVWTQGQGKYTSHWLPSFDDVNEKLIFNVSVDFYSDYSLNSNGLLIEKTMINDSISRWTYQMKQPMSSYLVAIAAGRYSNIFDKSASGIPLEMYYAPYDSLKAEPTYRYTTEIFNFLEEEIGVAYPWEIHRQVPVHDFLYAGMENTTLTIFSDSYMVDDREFNDKNYVNVNAHELAHHWFGNLVTAQSSEHHWLHEGFSTYYALLAERHVFGDDYFYWRLYEYANQLKAQQQSGSATGLLNAQASSLTFYQKGAVVLYLLRKKIGDKAFKNAVANYLHKHSFAAAKTSDFIRESEAESGISLSNFVSKWLEENSFDYDDVLEALKDDSMLIRDYEMIDCELFQSKCKDYLTMPLDPKIKSKLIAQYPNLINQNHFNEGWEVRQAIAITLTEIPEKLKSNFESLLQDTSYVTVESALYKLWTNFPKDREKYLDKLEEVEGNNLKNVRLLWLALAIATPEYKIDNKNQFIEELINYTSKDFSFEIRQSAFSYLKMLNLWSPDALNNLYEASKHHNWRFQSYSKEIIEKLSAQSRYKEFFNSKN